MTTAVSRRNNALTVEEAVKACAAGDELALKRIYDAEAARMLGVRLGRRSGINQNANLHI